MKVTIVFIAVFFAIGCRETIEVQVSEDDGPSPYPPCAVKKKTSSVNEVSRKKSGSEWLSTPKSGIIFSSGFERNNLDNFDLDWLNLKSSVKITDCISRTGKSSLEVTLRRSDPMKSKGIRSELAVPGNFEFGKEYWYKISIFIPQSWVDDFQGDVLTQWFAIHDKDLGEKGRSPALALRIRENRWHMTYRWDDKPLTSKNGGNQGDIWSGKVKKGAWTTFTVNVKWDWTSKGYTALYVNKKFKAERKGPNCYNDKKGPIWKFGVYKAPWNDPEEESNAFVRLAYFDDIVVCTGDCSAILGVKK